MRSHQGRPIALEAVRQADSGQEGSHRVCGQHLHPSGDVHEAPLVTSGLRVPRAHRTLRITLRTTATLVPCLGSWATQSSSPVAFSHFVILTGPGGTGKCGTVGTISRV